MLKDAIFREAEHYRTLAEAIRRAEDEGRLEWVGRRYVRLDGVLVDTMNSERVLAWLLGVEDVPKDILSYAAYRLCASTYSRRNRTSINGAAGLASYMIASFFSNPKIETEWGDAYEYWFELARRTAVQVGVTVDVDDRAKSVKSFVVAAAELSESDPEWADSFLEVVDEETGGRRIDAVIYAMWMWNKIDKMFVRAVEKIDPASAVVAAILGLNETLGVGEGGSIADDITKRHGITVQEVVESAYRVALSAVAEALWRVGYSLEALSALADHPGLLWENRPYVESVIKEASSRAECTVSRIHVYDESVEAEACGRKILVDRDGVYIGDGVFYRSVSTIDELVENLKHSAQTA